MGSGPTEAYVKELEREAYAALLRAVYVKANVDIFVRLLSSRSHHDAVVLADGSADAYKSSIFYFMLQNLETFLVQARTQLNIDVELAKEVFEDVKTDVELIS